MISIIGYSIKQELYNGSRTVVYRAVREKDQKPVAIKLLKNHYPEFSELQQFRNQYMIARNLDIPGIVNLYALEPYQNGYALIMEDFGGCSLREYLLGGNTISLQDILSIALQVTDILNDLHQNRVIHKDIKPANILIHPETKQVKIIDFSIASVLPKETEEINNLNSLEGTLAYLSPEQTGRMNRGIDYRADFYALGVTLFELLTGELPFKSDDPMELVHSHIAKKPPSINSQEIPPVLSDIIMKLMAKNPEDRYQSTLGLKHDLETCLYQLKENGNIEDFKIGKTDISDIFLISEKLYGREKVIQQLLESFERVSNGNKEVMLVTGFSGIGKTAVVDKVRKPIIKQGGYFIKGKFEQFNLNIPLDAFIEAFQDLIGQLLSESDTQLLNWKNHIFQALGENAQVIIDIVPELEKITGKQPPTIKLFGTAAQNRFNLSFQSFIQVFSKREHPLVIFLDDLQWADSASLKLMQFLMSQVVPGHLLLIGTYRNNEVSSGHPLMLTLKQIEKSRTTVNTITLENLSQANLAELVADTLNCNPQLAQPLTEVIYQKTQGNAFFATQFIKLLHQENFIYFNYYKSSQGLTKRGWQCDITKIREETLTDSVVELIAQKLDKIPIETQNILKLAACFGNQFDLKTLAIISEISELHIENLLWKALQLGLILPQSQLYKFYVDEQEVVTDNSNNQTQTQTQNLVYRFLHDRVRQAAYSLVPDEQKFSTHQKIGKLLLKNIPSEAREDYIFELVNQLNYGITLITAQAEREELAKLNLTACRKAKSNIDYEIGRSYASIGLSLLGDEAWSFSSVNEKNISDTKQYEMNLKFHELAAELAFLCGDFESMEKLIEIAIARANSFLDRINFYEIKIQSYVSQNKLNEAIAIGINVLQQLGIAFPETPTRNDYQSSITEIEKLIGNRQLADFIYLPRMTDREKIAIIQIANSIMAAAYISASPLHPLLVTLSVKLSIECGNTASSAFAYASYGVIICNILHDISTGVAFGELAAQLVSELNIDAIKSETLHVVGLFTLHRKSHIKKTLPLLEAAHRTALEIGNMEFVGYTAQGVCLNSFLCGKPLATLERETGNYCKDLVQRNQLASANYCRIYWQSILNLLEVREYPSSLSGEVLEETEFLPLLIEARDLYGLYFFYFHKLMLCYLHGEIKSAQNHAVEARGYLMAVAGTVGEPGFYFYDSLVALAGLSSKSRQTSVEFTRVEENQIQLQDYWAAYAPMNHQHKVYLVSAEKCRILGQKARAIELYDKAISLAKANEYIHEAALANELAARFYLDWGKEKIAQVYMQEAYYCYARWGAASKNKHLEKWYPQLLTPILQQVSQDLTSPDKSTTIALKNISIHTSTKINSKNSTSFNNALDFAAIIKASQALSSTIKLGELLRQLTQIILQNSGGDRCGLILPNENAQWYVRAIATSSETKLCSQKLENNPNLPTLLIQYVKNTQEIVVIDDLNTNLPVIGKYLLEKKPRSVLCLPILYQNNLIGILYLKNSSTSGVFTEERIGVLNFLCTQAAISLENARLYSQEQTKTREIAQKEQEYRSIFESINDGLLICDLETGKIIAANPTLCQIYNYTQQEFSSLTPADLLHPNYLHLFDNYLENLREGTKFYTQGIGRRKDSSFFDFEVKAVPLMYQGKLHGLSIIRDITHSKQSEDHLRQLSVRFNLAVKSAGMGIWDWDITKNQLIWDKRMYNLYGITPETFSNAYEAWVNCLHPDDRPAATAYSTQCLQGGKDYDTEFRVIHPDGSVRFIKATALIQRNHQGEAQRMIGINYDITDQKQAEIQLQQTNEELIRATRLKDEFLANMSHELRTPLNAILGMTEGLQEEVFGELTEKQRKPLQTIERSGSHLLELINDILDVAKIESGQLELDLNNTAIAPLCQSSLAFIKQQALKKSIKLETKLPLDLPDVLIDERRIRQVLINLLNNAVKFTTPGGCITLSVNIFERSVNTQAANKHIQNYLQIAVMDTGIGIAQEHMKKLFQPFVQIDSALNRQYAGTGLGLVLVKRIVELHGGDVGITSEVGVGSCFTIDLPCIGSASHIPETEIQSLEKVNPQLKQDASHLILLAEDNEANISTVSSYLKAKGYRLVLARNGREAVATAKSATPDLILMDIQMPEMDGLEAMQRIRLNSGLANIPIIALTALAMKGDRERCLEKGANDYLSKPVKLKQLTGLIQQFLAAPEDDP